MCGHVLCVVCWCLVIVKTKVLQEILKLNFASREIRKSISISVNFMADLAMG